MMDPRLEQWIAQANARLSQADVPHRHRPARALGEWSVFTGRSITWSDPEARWIFQWFERNSKPRAHELGSLYEGVLFFDAEIWKVSVPILYGSVQLTVEQALRDMPEPIRDALLRDPSSLAQIMALWADCIDYALGIDDIKKTTTLAATPQTLILAADKELRGTVRLLHESPASQKSAETARMAAEMFLKAFITARTGLTEEEVKERYSHHLDLALGACLELDPGSDLRLVQDQMQVFPPIKARYTPGSLSLKQLWMAYAIAQSIGSTVVRHFSKRDCRSSLVVS